MLCQRKAPLQVGHMVLVWIIFRCIHAFPGFYRGKCRFSSGYPTTNWFLSSWCPLLLGWSTRIRNRRKEKELERQQKIDEIKAQPVPRLFWCWDGGVKAQQSVILLTSFWMPRFLTTKMLRFARFHVEFMQIFETSIVISEVCILRGRES